MLVYIPVVFIYHFACVYICHRSSNVLTIFSTLFFHISSPEYFVVFDISSPIFYVFSPDAAPTYSLVIAVDSII